MGLKKLWQTLLSSLQLTVKKIDFWAEYQLVGTCVVYVLRSPPTLCSFINVIHTLEPNILHAKRALSEALLSTSTSPLSPCSLTLPVRAWAPNVFYNRRTAVKSFAFSHFLQLPINIRIRISAPNREPTPQPPSRPYD